MTNSSPQPPVDPGSKASETQGSTPAPANDSGSGAGGTQGLQKSITDFDAFVKLVAENLRYGSWTKRLVTIAGVAAVTLHPLSAGKVAEMVGVTELPKRYAMVFWAGLGGLSLGTVALAMATLPKKRGANADLGKDPYGAIKGLRSFEFRDAEIFAKLQRQRDVQDCYAAVTAPEFRIGVLMGESGCGKSSLLQAGVLPKLLGEAAAYRGVYVKFGDREPIAAVRAALKDLAMDTEGCDLLEVLEKASQTVGKPMVLLFDQFEQFFVQYKRQEERVAFIQSLKRWYDSELPVRILIGIRGDLADRLTEIQKILGYSLGPNESFRLNKFSPSQATAVLKVMAEAEGLSFDEGFVTELSKNELANREDGQISPVDVQVLAWMIVQQSDEELRAFGEKAFQRLGGMEGLLQRFLERTLHTRVGQVQRELTLKILLALTDRERNVRAGTLSIEELQTKLKTSGTVLDIAEAVDWLARSDVRLVTVVERETGRGYELAHERLILALLRVAKQELSEMEQANQLLERRVNEWLGNGKSERYLFSWKELRLLQRYRSQDALVWGRQPQWKDELLCRSQRRIRWSSGIVATPLVLTLLFVGWSQTTAGTMQWTRWQMISVSRRESLDLSLGRGRGNSITITGALAADLVTGVKNNPFPKFWMRWFAFEAISTENLSEIVKLTAEMEPQSAMQLLEQVSDVSQASRSPVVEAHMLAVISKAYGVLQKETKAQEVLSQALKLSESIEDDRSKFDALTSIAEAYIKTNDIKKAKRVLKTVYKSRYSCPLTDIYAEIGDFGKAFRSAQQCPIGNGEKVRALATILTLHAEQINPELKRLREKDTDSVETVP
jgi:tetratricopeptide (TPR) repeat protein